MPSSKALTNVTTGAGKLHPNVASAAADYQTSGGAEALIASMVAALNQEIAAPTFQTVPLALGATSVVLDASVYGPVWMGAVGETAKDVFDLVDLTDDMRVSDQTSLTPIYVTGVSGASVGSNSFTTNVITINLSGQIPATTNYRLLFSKQMSLGAFTKSTIATTRRFVPEAGTLEQQLFDMKWNGGGIGKWNDAPVCSLRTLALAGLNERYSRSSNDPSGTPTLNQDGDGHLIYRTGPAVTLQASGNQRNFALPPPDPYWAHYMITAGTTARSSNYLGSYDGGSGYVGVLQQKLTISAIENMGTQNMTVASRMDVIQRDVTGTAIGTGVVKTKVNTADAVGTAINPDAGATDDDRRTIRLATGDYFWESSTGSDLSEVAVGQDMIEMTLATGEVYTYVITTLFGGPHPSSAVPAEDQRRALVRDLTGGLPSFPSGVATTGMTFRFVKTKHFQGVGAQALRDKVDVQADPVLLGYHYVAVTPPLTSDPGITGSNEHNVGAMEVYAPGRTRGHDFLRYTPYALRWGGHDAQDHVNTWGGALRGDGAMVCTQINRRVRNVTVSTTSSVTWHPSLEGSVLDLFLTHASGNITVTIALDADYLNDVMGDGDELTVVIHNSDDAPQPGGAGGTATATFVWPTEFKFSGTDGVPNPNNGVGASVTVHKYHGIAVDMSDASRKFLMTLTSYLGAGL